jgi:hypothetical protein
VTMFTGVLATIAGLFPAVAMKLLDFVALYGMILMPMGAVVFLDFWLIPKLGMRSNYAQVTGVQFNWAAGLTWLATIGVCSWLVILGGVQIYFVSLPGWFIAAILYLSLSRIFQRKLHPAGSRGGAFYEKAG